MHVGDDRKALAKPHRTHMNPMEQEQNHMRELSLALKKIIMKKLLKANRENRMNSCLGIGSPVETTV